MRRRVSDPRALVGAAGYAVTLQVMHPAIAGGVRDHSTYAADPWARTFRTVDFVFLLCYGNPATVDRLVHDLRDAHRAIRGTDHHGHRYSGLDPDAYAWVHATLGESVVRAHDLMGVTFTPAERDRFWTEWLDLGGVLGVRPGDLPSSWADLQAYVTHMIDDVLEDNDVVQGVLANSVNPTGSSPFRWLPRPVFSVLARPAAGVARFAGLGMLPAEVRQRIGVMWTSRHEAAFKAYCTASKATTPLVPRQLRQIGPLVVRLRRHEVGPFGVSNEAATVSGW